MIPPNERYSLLPSTFIKSSTANEAFDSLSMLGDISGIVGGDLQSIGIAFGQAAAEGRVMTRDLRQFINNGVPILDILAESMGVARGEIMDMASEGKITFDILNQAFRNATGEGGKFAKVPTIKLLERLHKRNEYFCSSHHPLRETIMSQTGQSKEQRTKFLQKCYNSAKKKLIHNWDVEPKGTSTF